jgi:hypothetical protein
MENQEQNYEAPKDTNEIEDQQIPGDPSETASIDDAGDVNEGETEKNTDDAPQAGGPPTDNDQAVGQDADYTSQDSLAKSLSGDTSSDTDPGKAETDSTAAGSGKSEAASGATASDDDTDEVEEEGAAVTEGEDSLDSADTDPGKNANSGIEDISDKDEPHAQ